MSVQARKTIVYKIRSIKQADAKLKLKQEQAQRIVDGLRVQRTTLKAEVDELQAFLDETG